MSDNKKKKEEAAAALAGMEYQKSQAVQAAEAALADYQAQKPGAYVSGYQADIDAALDQILNREGFGYDLTADPAWQAYKANYAHQGKLAMQDTMANAAALTGGYGSSYAAAAGSQAYQGYLNQLTERIPALYQAALERYDSEGQAMADTLDALTQLEKDARSAHQADVDDWYKGLAQYADLAQAAYDRDYSAWQDSAAALADLRAFYAGQEQQDFERRQDEQAHALAVQKFEESVRQWQAEQAAKAAQQAEEQRRWEAEQAAETAKWQAQLALSRAELEYKKAKEAAAAAEKQAEKTTKKAAGDTSARAGAVSQSAVSLQAVLDSAAARAATNNRY